MKFKRTGAAVGIALVATLGAAACGDKSDNASGGSDSKSSSNCQGRLQLKASGSTAQAQAMQVFNTAFSSDCNGANVDYNANGSGGGVTDFNNKLTDFGGSDSPLKDDEAAKAKERCGSDALHIPAVIGPIAVGYNVSGVKDLALSGPTLAKIFQGQITNWNDPAIAADNKGKQLPDKPIKVLFRNDQSGTNDNFQKYLAGASNGAWDKAKTGKGFQGGTGEGVQGSNGVAAAVAKADGAIGYMEWSFATGANLNIANIITSAGPDPVQLNADSVGKTIDGAKLLYPGTNNLVLDTSSFYTPTTAGAYPIVLATYEIACSKYADADTGKGVKSFLETVISQDTQKQVASQGYVPVPAAFGDKLKAAVDSIS